MVIDSNKLKELLNKKVITKSALTTELSISSRTIAKINKGEEIADNVVMRLIKYFDCEFDDILVVNHVLETLRKEKMFKVSGGLYHQTQIKLTYNSNHIEGSKLTEDQTRYIFETHTVGSLTPDIPLDDVIETNNHFKCIDYIIEYATVDLNEQFIKTIQGLLKQGTKFGDEFGAGVYKVRPNTVGDIETCAPENVEVEMKKLISSYNKIKHPTFEDIVEFHKNFETIHPFQDGNGRVGRLIAFKECLKNNIVPFYIDDANKWFYYRGLREWDTEHGYLIETCKLGQDQYKQILDYFKVKY